MSNTPQGGANEGNAADDAWMVDQGNYHLLQWARRGGTIATFLVVFISAVQDKFEITFLTRQVPFFAHCLSTEFHKYANVFTTEARRTQRNSNLSFAGRYRQMKGVSFRPATGFD